MHFNEMTRCRSVYTPVRLKYYQPLLEDPRCEPLDCRDPLEDFNLGSSFVHLSGMLEAFTFLSEYSGVEAYIRTLPSSPAEANMQGFAGFHATELQQPFS